MHAGGGPVGYINEGILSSFLAHDIHPSVPMKGLGRRVGQPIIADEFVFAGKEAVVAIFAFCYVDNQVGFAH
jgi:hypothetical protein